jgi:hypothetical protein
MYSQSKNGYIRRIPVLFKQYFARIMRSARGYSRFFLPEFSPTLYLTILLISPTGSGSSRGNRMEPFAQLALERIDAVRSRVEAYVMRVPGTMDEIAVQVKRGHPVADLLLRHGCSSRITVLISSSFFRTSSGKERLSFQEFS